MSALPQALTREPPPAALRRWAVPLLLVAGCTFLLLHGLTAGELFRTEGLRALLGAEFLRGGGRVVPTLYGEPLLTKPPGMYAAIALASWPAGAVSAATARLPSVLAAGLAVWLFYRAFRRRLGRRAGLTAAAVLPASSLWLDRVPSAEIDMLQLAWVAAAVLFFLRALELHEAPGPRRRAEWLWWQAALLCVAGGLLTKWTAPAFFYLTAVPLLWWCGRLRCLWQAPHLAAAALAALPCLAWAGAAVAAVGWGTVYETVAREALLRLSPAHHPRPYPWAELLEFPAGVLLANLPWSLCLLPALSPGFARLWDERGRRLLQALHCWAWVNLLFWAVVPGHRPRHALPLQPALAGLAAMVWYAWLTGRLRWPLPARLRPLRVLVGLLVLWLAVKLAFVHVLVPRRGAERGARRSGEHLAALVPEGEVLYLCGLKDEGILFYYGRPARRVADFAHLPCPAPLHCLLTEAEWQAWHGPGTAEVLHRLRDEQGVGCVLVRLH